MRSMRSLRLMPQQVMAAIEAVANGMSLRKAAKMHSISKSVLHRYSKEFIPDSMRRTYSRKCKA